MASTRTNDQAPAPVAKRRYSLIGDVYNGAVHGDFAPDLGLAGITTQVVCGFVPVVGTLCAARDFVACQRERDRVGMLLNGLSLIPFLGGIPKLAEVVRGIRIYAEGIHAVHAIHHYRKLGQSSPDAAAQPAILERRSNPAAMFSLLIGLLVPVIAPLLVMGFEVLLAPHVPITTASNILMVALLGLAVPLLAILFGHAGRRRARGLRGYGSGRGIATTGLTLGYLYLVAFLAVAGVFLYLYRPNLAHVFASLLQPFIGR